MVWNYTTLKRLLSRHQSRYSFTTLWNYTTLKPRWCGQLFEPVLLPYEITLLSNKHRLVFMRMPVLLPYEITLLSNASGWKVAEEVVLLPYEITLLSNVSINTVSISRFYYLMKLHYSQTSFIASSTKDSFTTLWNYTTLKPQMRISCDTTIHRVTS